MREEEEMRAALAMALVVLVVGGANAAGPAGGIPEDPSTVIFQPPKRDPTAPRTPDRRDDSPESAPPVLTELPPLPEGKSAADILGDVPGTLPGPDCAALAGQTEQEAAKVADGSLADSVRALVLFLGHRAARISACPGTAFVAGPRQAVARIVETGLEACHLVIDADRDLEKEASDLARAGALRQAMGINQGRVAALEAFAPTCSDLTRQRMALRLRFARSRAARDRGKVECRLWQDRRRAEMAAVEELRKAGDWAGGIARLDGPVAAAIHGMIAACGAQSPGVELAKKSWVFRRKALQGRLISR